MHANSSAFAHGAPLGAEFGSHPLRNHEEFITFSAVQHADGTVTGTATVHDITAGVTARIDVNCLNVVGNTATISGIVTRSSDSALEGFEGIFQVVDGGEGGAALDLMSLANFFAVGTGADCTVPGNSISFRWSRGISKSAEAKRTYREGPVVPLV
jgi:hypothetical protein